MTVVVVSLECVLLLKIQNVEGIYQQNVLKIISANKDTLSENQLKAKIENELGSIRQFDVLYYFLLVLDFFLIALFWVKESQYIYWLKLQMQWQTMGIDLTYTPMTPYYSVLKNYSNAFFKPLIKTLLIFLQPWQFLNTTMIFKFLDNEVMITSRADNMIVQNAGLEVKRHWGVLNNFLLMTHIIIRISWMINYFIMLYFKSNVKMVRIFQFMGLTFHHRSKIKTIYHRNTILTVLGVFSIIIIASQALQFGLEVEVDSLCNSFLELVYFIIISMTTVGYGDFFPQSFWARTSTILSVFAGTILISSFIMALHDFTRLDSMENQAVHLFMRSQKKE